MAARRLRTPARINAMASPDVAAVFADAAVGGELAGARGVENRHARPALAVAIGTVHPLLAVGVGLVVGQHHVRIVMQQVADQPQELLAVAAGKITVADQVDHFAQLRLAVVELQRLIAGGATRLHLGRRQAEQEEVLRPDFLADLDVGAVHGAYGQRAIHLEFHVAGAGGFLAGS